MFNGTRFNPDAALVAIRALYNYTGLEQNDHIYYSKMGFTDYEPGSEDEKANGITGPGRGVLTVEGQQYYDNTRYRGFPVEVNMRKYTSELSVSEELMHWIEKGQTEKTKMELNNYVSDHVNALNVNVNTDACRIYYQGFGTTFFTGGDGKSLWNTAHQIRANANLYNNMFPVGDTQRAFSDTALIDAVNYMDRFVDYNGEEMSSCDDLLIICTKNNRQTVWKTLQSMYGPNTANLGKNVASTSAFSSQGTSIDYFVAQDIPHTYRNFWAIIDKKRAAKMLLMDWGWKPRLADQWERRKGIQYNDASVWFGPRPLSWQFGFASLGDGTTIS